MKHVALLVAVALLTGCAAAPVQSTAQAQTLVPFLWKDGKGTVRMDMMDVGPDFGYEFCLGFWDSELEQPVIPFACYKKVGQEIAMDDETGQPRLMSFHFEGYLIPGDEPIGDYAKPPEHGS